jgi:hypothetical protein
MLLPLLDADPDLLSRMQSIRDWDGNVSLDAVEKTGFVVELDRSHLRLSRATIVMSTPPKSSARHGADQSTRESFDAATLASIDKPTEVRGHIALTNLEAGGFLVKIEGTAGGTSDIPKQSSHSVPENFRLCPSREPPHSSASLARRSHCFVWQPLREHHSHTLGAEGLAIAR